MFTEDFERLKEIFDEFFKNFHNNSKFDIIMFFQHVYFKLNDIIRGNQEYNEFLSVSKAIASKSTNIKIALDLHYDVRSIERKRKKYRDINNILNNNADKIFEFIDEYLIDNCGGR